jgi:hypothetical protein
VHCRANEAYEAYRAGGVMKDGRRFGKPPTPYRPPPTPAGKVNVTDPDSRNVKTPCGYAQGYNAQAVCNERQIVVAAEINADSPDFGQLEPMVSGPSASSQMPALPARRELEVRQRLRRRLAEPGRGRPGTDHGCPLAAVSQRDGQLHER